MKHRFESKDHPLIFHLFATKINQVTQLYSRAAKLVEQLGFVEGLIDCVRLQFHNDFSCNQQIGGIVSHDDVFELNLNFRLQFNLHAAQLKFNLQGTLINLLQKFETKQVVNLKRRADELLRYRLE